ncbi:MAG TPA: lysozyme inhibitor LprI family protein [Steroidobacteraceae bacterium]|nr:lysozyme inhibitor LprI family protein [Steroidobacteraceae bacterium]
MFGGIMRRNSLVIAALLVASVAALSVAAEASELTSAPEFAESKAICLRLGGPKPPPADRPTPAQVQALKGCSSEKLYYGVGSQRDYVKARMCAFIEADRADDEVFSGRAILMQLYANGLGVSRDPDLATAYACQIEGAPAEKDARVLHMQALKTKPEHVDYCDDTSSGLAAGFCQNRDSNQSAGSRDARHHAMEARLPPAARALYAPMKKAFNAFVAAHGTGEVDLSGTARAALMIAEEDAVRNQFAKDLDSLLIGRWPSASAADAQAADAQMNASYHKAMAWAGDMDNPTTTKPDDIRKAQRAWLAYRDAFNRFAAAASDASADAVLARLTTLRTAQLDDLVGDAP